MKKQYKIDLDVYEKKKILESIDDFKDFGDITLSDSILSITGDTNEEIEQIFNEFMNYVIGLINE